MSGGESSVQEPATDLTQRVRPRRPHDDAAHDTPDRSELPTRRNPAAVAAVTPTFPKPGDTVVHFELVEEIGRGSFARVYLARQESLANRLVVVKVTTAPTDEPQNLARFQHTNVVPVYSVHAAGPLQVLCMPYLGRVTLAHMLAAPAADRRRSGRALFNAVLAHSSAPPPSPAMADALAALDRLTPVEACLWFVGQLAAGLGHAHARHILHRDLKPANVLVTDDGVPMLLDFNVSCESARGSGDGTVGGTLPYMAPEHLRAFLDPQVQLDERSDLYSLGVMLYELLADRLPYPLPEGDTSDAVIRAMIAQHEAPPPPPSRFNPAASPAVDAIVLKLLAPDPADRYTSAAEVREDLTRQLASRPLKFARNASVRERARKWRRRHPSWAVAGLAFALLVLPASLVAARQADLEARAARLQRAAAEGEFCDAAADAREAKVLLGAWADPAVRVEGLARGRAVLDRYGVGEPGWEARPEFALLEDDHRGALKAGFGELLVLMAGAEADLPAAVRWNQLAAPLFADADRPAVLARQRAAFALRQAGRPVPAFQAPRPEDAREVDLYFDGLDLAAAGRHAEALPLLARFCDRRPTHYEAWFARGQSHEALYQHADALTAFAVCVALHPDSPVALVNRGTARLWLGRHAEAEADFTRALDRKPDYPPALFNRGLARGGLRQYAAADADFAAALARPAAPARLWLVRSRVLKAAGDAAGAAAAKAEWLAREPAGTDAVSWAARGKGWMDAREPQKALADFEKALAIHTVQRDALLNKAIVLADLGREAEAIPVLDKLLLHYPDYADARGSRGVYHARLGHAAEARRDAADALRADPSPYRQFQVAGLHAQLAKADAAAKDAALLALARAVRAGFADANLLKTDPDLDPIRGDPRFAELTAATTTLDRLSREPSK